MMSITIDREHRREILAFEVSDAALEIAAGTTKESELYARGLHRPI